MWQRLPERSTRVAGNAVVNRATPVELVPEIIRRFGVSESQFLVMLGMLSQNEWPAAADKRVAISFENCVATLAQSDAEHLPIQYDM